MSDLTKVNKYIQRLNKITLDLNNLGEKLKDKNTSVDEWEELYAKEFFLSMQLVDIHENIHLIIDGMDDVDQLTKKRLRKEANNIFSPLTIDVDSGAR